MQSLVDKDTCLLTLIDPGTSLCLEACQFSTPVLDHSPPRVIVDTEPHSNHLPLMLLRTENQNAPQLIRKKGPGQSLMDSGRA